MSTTTPLDPADVPTSAGLRPTSARRSRDVQGNRRLALALLSPTFLVLALVVGYPVLAAFRQSLYASAKGLDANGFVVEGEHFAGLDNYSAIFQGGSAHIFWNAFWNTTFFTAVTVTLETLIGVVLALIMHNAFRGRGVVRASILVPWAVPTAISGLLWRWIFQSDGVANAIVEGFGGHQVLWTADGGQAKLAVIIAETWKTAPFIGLLVLAGLQVIPQEVYEAAKVDGASAWQRFTRITLPLVKPALMVAVLFRMLDVLRMFDLPYVLVGPHKGSVETLTMVAWDQAANLRYGPAAAYATVLFCYIALVAYLFVKLLGTDVIGGLRKARS